MSSPALLAFFYGALEDALAQLGPACTPCTSINQRSPDTSWKLSTKLSSCAHDQALRLELHCTFLENDHVKCALQLKRVAVQLHYVLMSTPAVVAEVHAMVACQHMLQSHCKCQHCVLSIWCRNVDSLHHQFAVPAACCLAACLSQLVLRAPMYADGE